MRRNQWWEEPEPNEVLGTLDDIVGLRPKGKCRVYTRSVVDYGRLWVKVNVHKLP